MDENLKDTYNQVTDDKTKYLFYSAKAAEKIGYTTIEVTDPATGIKKEVKFTCQSSTPDAPDYQWPDKELVWQGRASQMGGKYKQFLNDLTMEYQEKIMEYYEKVDQKKFWINPRS